MTLALRRVVAADSPRLLAWRNAPEVAAYMYSDHAISQTEHDRWFAGAMAAADRRYWIIEAEGGSVGLANLARVEGCDVLCVPGGFGTTDAMLDEAFMAQIRRLGGGARYLTSVCTGSLILAAAGFLKGRRAACHWAWRELLEPFGAIADEGRVVRDGNIITGGGVTAGIDFAFTLLAELAGEDYAKAVQLGLEYAPEPPFEAGRPELAPTSVREAVLDRMAPMAGERRAAAEEAARRLGG